MRKEQAKMFKDKKFLKEIAIILLVGAFVNGACFLLCSLTGHCETINSVLPYLCQNDNSFYNEQGVSNALAVINDKYPNTDIYNKKFFVCYGVYNIWYTYSDYVEVPAYYVYTCPDNLVLPTTWSGTSTFDNFQFNDSSCYIDVSLGNYPRYIVAPRSTSIDSSGFYCNEFSGGTVRLFGTVTTHNINNKYFELTVPGLNYPVYTTSQFSTVDRNANQGYILAFADTIVMPGDFTDLPDLEDLLDNISNSFSGGSNGTSNTPDQNKTDIQNFADFFNNLQSSINSNINNLGQNIKGWFDNLQKKLTDVANAISGNVYNGFKTLMSNIKEFFGPKLDAIIEKLDYIQEPFSAAELSENLNNANFSSDFLGLITTLSSFSTAFTSGSEPSTCSFTLDFSNSYYNFGVCEFSLDWILPFRSTIRLIVGSLCVYSLIVSIFTSLNTYIGGTSSINDDI